MTNVSGEPKVLRECNYYPNGRKVCSQSGELPDTVGAKKTVAELDGGTTATTHWDPNGGIDKIEIKVPSPNTAGGGRASNPGQILEKVIDAITDTLKKLFPW